MTNRDRFENLLERNWADVWDALDDAPDLVPRPKTGQITLRLPAQLLSRLRDVATARNLAYHALARSWLADGIAGRLDTGGAIDVEGNDTQLNLKVDPELLDRLKRRAHADRRAYHALARDYILAAVTREEHALGWDLKSASRPAMRDLIVLLLHSRSKRGTDAIRGMTRLQKLLFVVDRKVAGSHSPFYAYRFGPFSEEVNDATEALRLAGFLKGGGSVHAAPPTFAEMMATAEGRAGQQNSANQEYALSTTGHEAAESLRQSSAAYDALFDRISELRKDWDTPSLDDLVDHVYADWPEYTEQSVIRDIVEERSKRRHR